MYLSFCEDDTLTLKDRDSFEGVFAIRKGFWVSLGHVSGDGFWSRRLVGLVVGSMVLAHARMALVAQI